MGEDGSGKRLFKRKSLHAKKPRRARPATANPTLDSQESVTSPTDKGAFNAACLFQDVSGVFRFCDNPAYEHVDVVEFIVRS